MPITVAATSSSSSHQSTNGVSKVQAPPKKSRVVRRRVRARDLIDSDEEIERQISSESDLEDTESSLGSDTESESELASDDVPVQQYSVVTPSTTQSPPPADLDRSTHVNGTSSTKPTNGADSIFANGAVDWSEMVADEHRNGPADLPVIDFADLGTHDADVSLAPPKQKTPKASKKPTATTAVPSSPQLPQEDAPVGDIQKPEGESSEEASRPSSRAPFQRRPPGQTARQAYQRRLESDPSYVPVVGEFWGHDDRLLDKELRSLSGWWRGRWQGRGRGRGGMAMRGRGRGGFFSGAPSGPAAEKEANAEKDDSQLPPVERTWTHDGFEEMKLREEQRRAVREEQQRQQQQQQQQTAQRGFGPFRGRGGFIPGRGRGGFFRGGYNASPTRSRPYYPLPSTSDRPQYAMKPEPPFTKRHSGYLHFGEGALKPQHGVGQGYRVKLPGDQRQGGTIIRGPPLSFISPKKVTPQSLYTPGLHDEDKFITVRLPKRAGKEKAVDGNIIAVEAVVTVAEHPVELSPRAPAAALVVEESSSMSVRSEAGPSKLPEQAVTAPPFTPTQAINVFPEQLRAQVAQEQAHSPNAPTSSVEHLATEQSAASLPAEPFAPEPRLAPPVLPPLQTSFSPIAPTSPTFGSPYGYPQPLPPGIAMTQHGMPYEVATGRPVYLQATPPPPMYNPRPIMHGHVVSPPMPAFVPGHTPHHSLASPDFYSHSPSPSLSGFIDPSTGQPLFTLPRQSSRIEIRAPTDQLERKPSHRPSTLRTAVVGMDSSFTEESTEPQQAEKSEVMQPSGDAVPRANGDIPPQAYQVDPGMMVYNPYQQPYYYPEHYGYPPYMDMSHGQMPPYEMYPAEPPPPQQAVYY
ncbi:hypothetical protein NEOLEDRAFT_1116280 [Neolentinus lepideus HHB14362 ss-1]|uniref:Btz domain-containing protein n=1 Tax=Neolentinus lepideus HHB14362 ss-1 TaxID=1314782 RepID=A0A165S251_9AGAM|nr:hypothetical protein NEOLEDRAFT_1116280 [Neolentinus lepideus HHB14362 ss-1]